MGVQTDSELKLYNREVKKIVFEHVYDPLKTFQMFSKHYRNRSKRLELRSNLIVEIYNMKLNKK